MDRIQKALSNLQVGINLYVRSELSRQQELFALKKEYLNKPTFLKNVQEELQKSIAELIALHEENSKLHVVSNFHDYTTFLEDSVFFESLTKEEKRFYLSEKVPLILQDKLKENLQIYDEQIPYYSELLQVNYLAELIAYLKTLLPKSEVAIKSQAKNEVDDKPDFMSNFSQEQLALLVECCNASHLFTSAIDIEILQSVFNCTLVTPLVVKNNRLLVYFFSGLDDRNYITRQWQSVIDKYFKELKKH